MISSCEGKSKYNGQTFNFRAEVYVQPITDQPRKWAICRLSASILPDTDPIRVSYDHDLSAATYEGLVPGKFMRKWLVSGPMLNQIPDQIDLSTKEGQQIAFDTDPLDFVNFSPTVRIGNQDYEWVLMESSNNILDLNRIENGNNYETAYAWAQVEMPEEKTATLGIGSDDSVKVWLNGDLVHENFVNRVTIFNNDQVQVTFKKGTNQLVLKVQNFTGPWNFCCRVMEE